MKRSRTIIVALICGLASAPFIDSAEAQTGARAITPADWPMYNHDPEGTRSNGAETRLRPDNVGGLQVQWAFQTRGAVAGTPAIAIIEWRSISRTLSARS